ncbi:hypothetical protein BLX24_22730 [Arsenicibacter rosenii]|uniref:Uncharacterized protein n=1 Tax=Arsenicibacter rosenii TaxID=1750698 RepID=A0A1S2VDJ3_9BACT|nr:hypothetical protein BLX24_22730 [Arsenicibacter rosenii]
MPRVRKFLSVKLEGNPLVAHVDNPPFGSILWALCQIEKTTVVVGRHQRDHRRIYFEAQYSDKLHVLIAGRHHTRRNLLLNQLEAGIFNRLVLHSMHNELVQLLAANDRRCQSDAEVLRAWVDRYDLSEDDVTEDSLMHIYKRVRSGVQHAFSATVPQMPEPGPFS